MPIRQTEIQFVIHDYPTLNFMDHCFDHWRDFETCTEADVVFMKHLVRSIFGLHYTVRLLGIRFSDDTLAMVSPSRHDVFFVLTRGPLSDWSALRVDVEGFAPRWGAETGFWEGLDEHVVVGKECVGPQADDCESQWSEDVLVVLS